MVNRLIVHIGMAKTATTALQGFLFHNRAALREYGFAFPTTMALPTSGHFHFAHALIETPRASQVAGTLSDLAAEMATTDDDMILSAETLSTYSARRAVPERLAAFTERVERSATIVIYLRHQARFAESLYAQRVATGHTTGSFDEFVLKCLDNPLFDYADMLNRWSNCFADVVVRRFPPGDSSPIEYDFAQAARMKVNVKALPHPIVRRNERISARTVEYLRQFSIILHKNEASIDRRARLLRRMRDSLVRSDDNSGSFTALTPEIAARVEDRFTEGNDEVARRFLGENVLFQPIATDQLARVNIVSVDTPNERKGLRSAVNNAKRSEKAAQETEH